MNTYLLLKSLHIFGVVIFLGNIIVTGWWKVMVDRTKNPIRNGINIAYVFPKTSMAISSKGEDSRFLKTVSQCMPIFQYLFTFFPSISINS